LRRLSYEEKKMNGPQWGRFDAEGFRRRIKNLTDAELISTGKSVSHARSKSSDPIAALHNESEYKICREEWRRRHPKPVVDDFAS